MIFNPLAVLIVLAVPWMSAARGPTPLPPGFLVDQPPPKAVSALWPSRPHASDDMSARIRLYANFARIAFNNLTDWSCKLCQKPIISDTTLVRTFAYDSTRLYLYIAVNHRLREIITAFRGTVDTEGWLVDFKFIRVEFPEFGPGVSVHTGFLQSHVAGRDVVHSEVSALVDKYPDYGLHVVGHSMGAALASLQAQAMARSFPSHTVKLTSYGLPRIGNQAYADMVDSLANLDRVRFVHYTDPIPHSPPMIFGFHHHDAEFWCAEEKCTEFTQCATGQEDWACARHVIPDTNLRLHGMLPGVDW